ncbi:MAG: GFA family protein [Alphaproteobacteria bacterium]|nr:GFA family protein [Alphaproteobacteria bacterium]
MVREGGPSTPSWHGGGCHCGTVRFEVRADSTAVEIVDCNCSMCVMNGFQHLIVPRSDFRLNQGAEKLSRYTFNTGTAQHLFCSVCGIKSFYVPRSHPDGFSVNVRCLDHPDALSQAAHVPFDGRDWENAERLAPLETE